MIRWMEEILHHPGWLKPAPINRINHRSIGAGFLPHVWRKKNTRCTSYIPSHIIPLISVVSYDISPLLVEAPHHHIVLLADDTAPPSLWAARSSPGEFCFTGGDEAMMKVMTWSMITWWAKKWMVFVRENPLRKRICYHGIINMVHMNGIVMG